MHTFSNGGPYQTKHKGYFVENIETFIKQFFTTNKLYRNFLLTSLILVFILITSFVVYLKLKRIISHTLSTNSIVNNKTSYIDSVINQINETSFCEESSSGLDQVQSRGSMNSPSFEKIQTDVFNAVNMQYFAEKAFAEKTNNHSGVIQTNLNHISETGVFLIAPMDELSLNETSKEKSIKKTFLKQFRLNKLNLTRKQTKRQKTEQGLLDPNLKVVFTMNTYQQKHFLEIFGLEKNPIWQAKRVYKQKFRRKKSKLRKKLNSNKKTKLSLSSMYSTYSSMLLNDSLEHLDLKIKEFLENPQLSRLRTKEDNSGGLGRNNVVKLRKLIYKQNYSTESFEKEDFTDDGMDQSLDMVPEISFNIYNVNRVNSFVEVDSQLKTDQDTNKLIVLPGKKHK